MLACVQMECHVFSFVPIGSSLVRGPYGERSGSLGLVPSHPVYTQRGVFPLKWKQSRKLEEKGKRGQGKHSGLVLLPPLKMLPRCFCI